MGSEMKKQLEKKITLTPEMAKKIRLKVLSK
jgi:hypothetical protein